MDADGWLVALFHPMGGWKVYGGAFEDAFEQAVAAQLDVIAGGGDVHPAGESA